MSSRDTRFDADKMVGVDNGAVIKAYLLRGPGKRENIQSMLDNGLIDMDLVLEVAEGRPYWDAKDVALAVEILGVLNFMADDEGAVAGELLNIVKANLDSFIEMIFKFYPLETLKQNTQVIAAMRKVIDWLLHNDVNSYLRIQEALEAQSEAIGMDCLEDLGLNIVLEL